MVVISGYKAFELAWEEADARVFRAQRSADGQPVLVKVLSTEPPSVQALSRLKREYDLTATLPVGGVLKAHALVRYGQGLALIQEDFGGAPLQQWLTHGAPRLDVVLRLGIQLADTLGALHLRRIIHKDLHPGSVLFNPETREVRLARFGLASQLGEDNLPPKDLRELEGTLSAMSPEQTGRINRRVDSRTDLYSLGVTLYEALVGAPLFPAADALEWVHCHIAREPTPPHERKPSIPETVSRVVLKLLAKAVDARYQSAHGLKADLLRCLESYEATGSVEPFALGAHDFSDQFQPSEKLYGRRAELDALVRAFQGASSGRSGMVLISGQSGVGKSALMQELRRAVVEARGYFAHGKFDPFHGDKPFSALIDLFQDLLHQVFAEGEDRLALWRARLSGPLRWAGGVMVELLPELELLIGAQPPLPEVAPLEAQNRFHLAIQRFTQAFARPEHPLVLCLDDLQWADASSLNLLRLMATAPDSQALLLVGSYRDNEVGDDHPLTHMLEETERGGAQVQRMELKPLGGSTLCELLADLLHCDGERVMPLAELIEARTKGVPLLVNALLKQLESEALVAFDPSQREWDWDLPRIRAWILAGSATDLIRNSVLELSSLAREALEQAACLGTRFDLRTLSLLLGRTLRETAHCLWEAIAAGLVVPLDSAYRLFNLDEEPQVDVLNAHYQFAHDRVHQAAYDLFPASERPARHWRIGWRLLRHLKPEAREQQLLTIVNQLNHGRVLLSGPEERYELAELNLVAGRRARMSSDYQAALGYLRTGAEVLGKEGWTHRYALALALHTEATEAAYLSTAFDETSRLAEVALAHARSLLERVKVYESLINAAIAQNRLSEAAHLVLWVLEQLGIRFPKKPTKYHVISALLRIRGLLIGRRVEELSELRVTTEPVQLSIRRILLIAITPVFLTLPELFPLLALKHVELSIRHGNTAESATAYAVYAHILCVLGHYERAASIGTVALQLMKRLDAKALTGRVSVPVNGSVREWTTPIRELLKVIQQDYSTAMEVGDFEFFAHLANIYAQNACYSGFPLDQLESTLEENGALVRKVGQERAWHLHGLLRQVVRNLKGESPMAWSLRGPHCDEEHVWPSLLESRDVNLRAHFHLFKLILASLFRQQALAREHAAALEEIRTGSMGAYLSTVYVFYDALSAIAVAPQTKARTRRQLLAHAKRRLAKLRRWSELCPANQLHRVRLVEAELARVSGHPGEALRSYEDAILLAQTHQHLCEEALARELAGRFQLEEGRRELAAHYLSGAHGAWLRWGAKAKARDLEDSFPELVGEARTESPRPSVYEPPAALDHLTIIKASQAISGEIALERLLEKMMRIAMENAGAQKGFLLLNRQGRFFIEAEATLNTQDVRVLQTTPVDSHPELAHTVAHYVARTKVPVVLQNASQESRFASDPYILRRQPRSLLCIPLISQGHVTGLLYLENNHATGVFTPARVDLLGLLSAQMAISIENARLYNGLELKVKERTGQLEQRNQDLQSALQHLQTAQLQLVQSEKMASLGRLTSGIAHEIRNPLNFISNFAQLNHELSTELLQELEVERPVHELRKEVRERLLDFQTNTVKIIEHGSRADSIIRSMFAHSRSTGGERRSVVLKRLIEDSFHLAYHGIQGQHPGLRAVVEQDYDDAVREVELVPEDIGRVLLNLFNNALYSVHEKASRQGAAYVPRIAIETRGFQDRVEIRVRDNGLGVPEDIRQKVFEPFFTTKPPGHGTGLGLSLSYDIVQQGHGGMLRLEEGAAEGASFLIVLPSLHASARAPSPGGRRHHQE
jgi:predicted ATPase/signal transduction histidine kinase